MTKQPSLRLYEIGLSGAYAFPAIYAYLTLFRPTDVLVILPVSGVIGLASSLMGHATARLIRKH